MPSSIFVSLRLPSPVFVCLFLSSSVFVCFRLSLSVFVCLLRLSLSVFVCFRMRSSVFVSLRLPSSSVFVCLCLFRLLSSSFVCDLLFSSLEQHPIVRNPIRNKWLRTCLVLCYLTDNKINIMRRSVDWNKVDAAYIAVLASGNL